MASRGSGLLLPRSQVATTVGGGPPFHSVVRALTMLLAGALAIGVFLFTPRPDVHLTNAEFFESTCLPTAMTRDVASTFTLTNSGAGDGYVFVHLHVDGTDAAQQAFTVPARSSLPGQLGTALGDCGHHTYSLSICYPTGKTVTC